LIVVERMKTQLLLDEFLVDLSESESELTSSAEEADTVNVQASSVELDKEQVALYKGSREYQAITVEHYCIGIYQQALPFLHIHTYALHKCDAVIHFSTSEDLFS